MSATESSDVGVGLGMVFGGLALAASVYTLVAATQRRIAYGFAAAVTLGVLTIAVIHLYWR
jgi:hypothetical protein